MNVKELIKELEGCHDKDMEVGYEVNRTSLELLVGEDSDNINSNSITIPKPEWC